MSGIIVGVDGSGHSHRALEWAMNEAAVRHAPLTVITVSQAFSGPWGVEHFPRDEALAERAGKAVMEAVEKAQAKLGDAHPASVTVQPVYGLPAEEILKASRGADLVVLGSRGAGGFARLLLGSVSSQLVHHASCPVVVIPPEDKDLYRTVPRLRVPGQPTA